MKSNFEIIKNICEFGAVVDSMEEVVDSGRAVSQQFVDTPGTQLLLATFPYHLAESFAYTARFES